MVVSYNWLNDFFDEKLPPPERVVEALTFHAWEIEETTNKDGDTIIEVNVLPDTAAWALSHRGIAKYLSVILELPLTRDPLAEDAALEPVDEHIRVAVHSEHCNRYAAAFIKGVSVEPSPEWLQQRLRAIGQKPINNIVDATNYVMFELGQPLHAFDAGKLEGEAEEVRVAVRNARSGEGITTLTGESYELTPADMLIVDDANDVPIGIAGVKGGMHAEVTKETTDVLIESANFDAATVRKTSKRIKLRTDASQRFENGVVPDLAAYGLTEACALIVRSAGGSLRGYTDTYPNPRTIEPVSVTLTSINALLGLALTTSEVESILTRFGYTYEVSGETFTVTPPLERTDLMIAADLIEEIGRIYGYEHVPSVVPEPVALPEVNKRFWYAERIRAALTDVGFSEILTSSFRETDTVRLANAFAADKGCLRSSLRANHDEALEKNRVNADLLGLTQIKTFEIGTVFTAKGEHTALALGVRSPGGYKSKKDDPALTEAITALSDVLGLEGQNLTPENGILEIDLEDAIAPLDAPQAYDAPEPSQDITYRPFSSYPFVTRDIALWTKDADARGVRTVLEGEGGDLLTRTTLFDTFEKDGATSYAFRLVFQSSERTLTDEEVNAIMDRITDAVTTRKWTVR